MRLSRSNRAKPPRTRREMTYLQSESAGKMPPMVTNPRTSRREWSQEFYRPPPTVLAGDGIASRMTARTVVAWCPRPKLFPQVFIVRRRLVYRDGETRPRNLFESREVSPADGAGRHIEEEIFPPLIFFVTEMSECRVVTMTTQVMNH